MFIAANVKINCDENVRLNDGKYGKFRIENGVLFCDVYINDNLVETIKGTPRNSEEFFMSRIDFDFHGVNAWFVLTQTNRILMFKYTRRVYHGKRSLAVVGG